MTFDKKAYMRDYMARRRAGKETHSAKRMADALTKIIDLTAGKTGEAAVAIRTLAEDALA